MISAVPTDGHGMRIVYVVAGLLIWGCQSQYLDLSATTAEHAQEIHMVSNTKRVVHYNCNGSIAQDLVEKVQPAEQMLVIPLSREPVEIKVYNASTNSRAGCVLDNSVIRISELGDACSMKVKKGLNEVHYGIFYCLEPECAEEPEDGTLFLNVSIEDELVGGLDQIQPECSEIPALSATDEELLELSKEFLKSHPLSFDFEE